MRHPFWSWTGLLGLSLAGCLHGNDVRQATLRTVADRSENVAVAPIVGPARKSMPEKATPTQSAKPWGKWFGKSAASQSQKVSVPSKAPVAKKVIETPLANVAQSPVAPAATAPPPPTGIVSAQHTVTAHRAAAPAAPAQVGKQQSETIPTTQPALLPKTEARPLSSNANVRSPVVPPIAPEVVLDSSALPPQEPRPFAEFERAIPLKPVDVSKPRRADAPADMEIHPLFTAPSQPTTTRVAPKKELSDPPQESPIVSNTATAPRAAETSARPRDVALMIEQIFDDLRQHRLSEARARTERLKRLIDGRSANDGSFDSAATPASIDLLDREQDADASVETATKAAKEPPEKFFDDEEPLND